MPASPAHCSVMKIIATSVAGAVVIEPRVFSDSRGFVLETFNQKTMAAAGIEAPFVQDNHSYSTRNVLRGLHYQVRHPQGKLVCVVVGEILDVAVDLRKSSPTFGRFCAVHLSGDNKHMVWVPPGLAHGFRVISESAHVIYKMTESYYPEFERTIAWNDPELDIDWQLDDEPVVSAKDMLGSRFCDAEMFE